MRKAEHHRWEERPVEALREGITRRFVTGERVMLGEVRFKKGDRVPAHSHMHEQITHVVEGCLRFTLGDDGEDVIVRAGEAIVIPPDLPHGVEALADTLEYDAFNPPRQDWIDPASDFLRE